MGTFLRCNARRGHLRQTTRSPGRKPYQPFPITLFPWKKQKKRTAACDRMVDFCVGSCALSRAGGGREGGQTIQIQVQVLGFAPTLPSETLVSCSARRRRADLQAPFCADSFCYPFLLPSALAFTFWECFMTSSADRFCSEIRAR